MRVFAGRGNDSVFDGPLTRLGPGDDRFEGEAGAGGYEVYGGRGRDVLSGGVPEGEGPDDPDSADRLDGGAGKDPIEGRWGPDRLFGRAGHDLLRGGRGDDAANGGRGNDTCRAEQVTACEG